jgi:hypothetical protein
MATSFLGRLENAIARAAGHLEDDIGALLVLSQGDFLGFRRVIPCGSTRNVLYDHLGGIDTGILGALFEANDEVVDDRDVHGADRADALFLRHQGGIGARDIGAFILLIGDRIDVLAVAFYVIHRLIVDDELLFGVLWSDQHEEITHLPRTNNQDIIIFVRGCIYQGGLPLFGSYASFNCLDFQVKIFGGLLHTAIAGVEEGFVAQDPIDQVDYLDFLGSCRGGSGCRRGGAGRQQQTKKDDDREDT